MPFPRSSGILLHPTGFPSPFGIGDLGPSAFEFIDFLKNSGQKLWQILPLGTPGYGNSPYLAYSAMAGNPLLISPEKLAEVGLLHPEDWANLPHFSLDSVEFEQVQAYKIPLLWLAYDRFVAAGRPAPAAPTPAPQAPEAEPAPAPHPSYQEFCAAQVPWLEDYALYMALKAANDDRPWYDWEDPLRQRHPAAIAQARQTLAREIDFQRYLQFEFSRQWSALKTYANGHGISIMGDIPIYVAPDSADVWSCPHNFCLDPVTSQPALMAGVPPDYFSETGQLWGNPVYNWDYLTETEFAWWIQRFQVLLNYVDIIRIDHFRGFEAYWAVPQGETTALNGTWIEAPGHLFFKTLEAKLGKLPIVAEDLGIITPEVEAVRDQFGFPGMKILQFAFDSGSGNAYLPFNYEGRDWVVYPGTHDNDTTVGWFESRSPDEQQWVTNYLGSLGSAGIHWDLIRIAFSSVANQAIIAFQDILGLGSNARMNRPSTASGNWGWRYRAEALNDEVQESLRVMTQLYGR